MEGKRQNEDTEADDREANKNSSRTEYWQPGMGEIMLIIACTTLKTSNRKTMNIQKTIKPGNQSAN